MAATSTAVGAVPECNTSMYMQRLEGRTSEGGHGHKEGDVRSNECKQRGGQGEPATHTGPTGAPQSGSMPAMRVCEAGTSGFEPHHSKTPYSAKRRSFPEQLLSARRHASSLSRGRDRARAQTGLTQNSNQQPTQHKPEQHDLARRRMG